MTWEGAWSSRAKTTVPISHSTSVQLIQCYLIYRGLARRLEGDMGLKGIQANTVHLILIYPSRFSAYHWGGSCSWSCSLFWFFCDFFFRQIEFTTLDFTLPDAKQVIFDPMSAHDPLGVSSLQEVGVQFLCRKPRWVPWSGQAPSDLRAGGLGCCVQGAVGSGGAEVGKHLSCAPCAGTTRAGGMSISSLCPRQLQALPHGLPP